MSKTTSQLLNVEAVLQELRKKQEGVERTLQGGNRGDFVSKILSEMGEDPAISKQSLEELIDELEEENDIVFNLNI